MGFEVLLGLLSIVIVLAIPVAVIVLLIRVADLRRRMERLERQIATQPVAPAAATAESVPTPVVAKKPVVPVEEPTSAVDATTGPWEDATTGAPPPPLPPTQDGPIVFQAERISALANWSPVQPTRTAIWSRASANSRSKPPSPT